MEYKPTPGTTPFKVIELLNARGGELSSHRIAADLDISQSTLPAFMKTALSYGAVIVDKRDGINYWRLGEGRPAPAVKQEESIPSPPAPTPRLTELEFFGRADEGVTAPAPPPGPDTRAVRCAIWSDGSMTVQRGDERIEFTPEQASVISGYISGTV